MTQIEPELSLYTLTGLAGQYPGTDLVAAVTALICLRYLADENEPLADGADEDLAATPRAGVSSRLGRSAAPLRDPRASRPRRDGWRRSSTNSSRRPGAAVRHSSGLWRPGTGSAAGALSASAVTPALARLIAELSGARELARRTDSLIVTDPAAGAGDLLAAVAHVLGPDCTPMFTGAEADPVLARLVRRRLTVHGVPAADMDIRVGAELPDEPGDPDVIVTQIPYRPGEERDAVDVLDSVDDVAVRMTTGRFAVVLGPAAVLADDLPPFSAAARARADLLKADMVEAIIRLPGGLVPFRPGYETALWVLTQARQSRWRGRVLLADVSDRPLTATWSATWPRTSSPGGVTGTCRRRTGGRSVSRRSQQPGRPAPPADDRSASRQPAGAEDGRRRARRAGHPVRSGPGPLRRDRHRRSRPCQDRGAGGSGPAAGDGDGRGAGAPRRLVMRKGTRLGPADVDGSGQHVVLGAEEVLGFRRLGSGGSISKCSPSATRTRG